MRGTGKEHPSGLSMAERYPRTISFDLFASWRLMLRPGDPARIQRQYKISRPIVDRALNYGNVKQSHVERKISQFFTERYDGEKRKGKKLIKIAKG